MKQKGIDLCQRNSQQRRMELPKEQLQGCILKLCVFWGVKTCGNRFRVATPLLLPTNVLLSRFHVVPTRSVSTYWMSRSHFQQIRSSEQHIDLAPTRYHCRNLDPPSQTRFTMRRHHTGYQPLANRIFHIIFGTENLLVCADKYWTLSDLFWMFACYSYV